MDFSLYNAAVQKYGKAAADQAIKNLQAKGDIQAAGQRFVDENSTPRSGEDFSTAMRPAAASGLTNNGTLYPGGLQDVTQQDIQNTAAAPNIPTPTRIVRAEQVAQDPVVALNTPGISTQDAGTAVKGFMAEAPVVETRPSILQRAAYGVATGTRNAIQSTGKLGLSVIGTVAPSLVDGEDAIQEEFAANQVTDQQWNRDLPPIPAAKGILENATDIISGIAPYVMNPVLGTTGLVSHGIVSAGEKSLEQGEDSTRASVKAAMGGLTSYGLTKLPMTAAGVASAPAIGVIDRTIQNNFTENPENKVDVLDPTSIGTDIATMSLFALAHKSGWVYDQAKQQYYKATVKERGLVPVDPKDVVSGLRKQGVSDSEIAKMNPTYYDYMLKERNIGEQNNSTDPVVSQTEATKPVVSQEPAISDKQNKPVTYSELQAQAANIESFINKIGKTDDPALQQTVNKAKESLAAIEQQLTPPIQPANAPAQSEAQTATPAITEDVGSQAPVNASDDKVQAAIEKARAAIAARKGVTVEELPPLPQPAAETSDQFEMPDYKDLLRKKANLESSLFRPDGEVKAAANLKMVENYAKINDQIKRIETPKTDITTDGSVTNVRKEDATPQQSEVIPSGEEKGRGQEVLKEQGADQSAPVSGSIFIDAQDALGKEIADAHAKGELTPELVQDKIKGLASDRITGFQGATFQRPTLDLAWNEHKNSDRDFSYADVDLANLGGLNAHSGSNEKANVHFRAISDIVRDEVLKDAPTARLFRHGGDEFSIVAPDTSKDILEAALARAQDKVEQYAVEQGLDVIPHPKHKEEAPHAPGIGIYYGVTDFLGKSGVHDIITTADGKTSDMKRRKGADYVRRSQAEKIGNIAPELSRAGDLSQENDSRVRPEGSRSQSGERREETAGSAKQLSNTEPTPTSEPSQVTSTELPTPEVSPTTIALSDDAWLETNRDHIPASLKVNANINGIYIPISALVALNKLDAEIKRHEKLKECLG